MAVKDTALPADNAENAETEETGPSQVEEIVSLIGPKLRALRSAQRLSLQQLAMSSDVSAAAIHKIERNGMVPTITTLFKVGGNTYRLGKGDSLHFGGQMPHHWANEGKHPVKAIWVALRNG